MMQQRYGKKTGWIFNHFDEKWRWELNDSIAKFVDLQTLVDNIKKNYTYRLSDVLEYQDLYYLYPEAKDIRLCITETFQQKDILGAKSYPNPYGTFIIQLTIHPRKYETIKGNPDEKIRINTTSRSICCHEVQHFLQRRHGFRKPDAWEEIVRGIGRGIERAKLTSNHLRPGIKKERLLAKIKWFQDNLESISDWRYRAQLGEREAWDVSYRLNFSEDERRKIPPFPLDPKAGFKNFRFLDTHPYQDFNEGGKLPNDHDFASSEKSPIFVPINVSKDEIDKIISGARPVTNGAAIQAASNFLRRGKSTGDLDRSTHSAKRQEEARLSEYISKNNLWLPFPDPKNKIGEGGEAKVYLDGTNVIKFNDAPFYASWEDYFNSLLIHNYFFPTTSYELIGFSEYKDYDDRILYAIVKQPFIEATSITHLDSIKKIMDHNGFINNKRDDYYNPFLGLILEDLHEGNVLTKDGILYFIDTVFYIKNENSNLENGGNIDDFANSEKSRKFIPTKITKDELQSILSGASKTTDGDTIQAALAYIRAEEGANPILGRTKSGEKERLIEFIDKNDLWYSSALTPPDGLGKGEEHVVYDDPSSKDFILKTNNLSNYHSWSDYLVNLLLNNTSSFSKTFLLCKSPSIMPRS